MKKREGGGKKKSLLPSVSSRPIRRGCVAVGKGWRSKKKKYIAHLFFLNANKEDWHITKKGIEKTRAAFIDHGRRFCKAPCLSFLLTSLLFPIHILDLMRKHTVPVL